MSGTLIIILVVLLLLLGAPLFVVIGSAAFLCVVFIEGGVTEIGLDFFSENEFLLTGVMADLFEATKKEVLLAIPFFLVAGSLMTGGSIATRLIAVAKAAVGWIPGGLAIATVFSCAFFAAISGSSPVTVIAIGSMMFPALVKDKYEEHFSLGLVTTSGSLGILIPPSIPMILYAVMVSSATIRVSVIDLFIAGVGPGIFIILLLSAYSVLKGHSFEIEKSTFQFAQLKESLKQGGWSLVLPVLILGGIYGGFFTATEAAAVAAVYAFVVEVFIHRELKIKEIPKIIVESALLMGSLFLILVLAIALNKFLTIQQIPQQGAELIAQIVDSKIGFLIAVNIFLLLLGCLMDIMSAILIVAPILAAMAQSFDINPIHFGIVFIVNMEIGYLTPPVGINLFVSSSLFNKPITEMIQAIIPYILIMFLALAGITYFETISLGLLKLLE